MSLKVRLVLRFILWYLCYQTWYLCYQTWYLYCPTGTTGVLYRSVIDDHRQHKENRSSPIFPNAHMWPPHRKDTCDERSGRRVASRLWQPTARTGSCQRCTAHGVGCHSSQLIAMLRPVIPCDALDLVTAGAAHDVVNDHERLDRSVAACQRLLECICSGVPDLVGVQA